MDEDSRRSFTPQASPAAANAHSAEVHPEEPAHRLNPVYVPPGTVEAPPVAPQPASAQAPVPTTTAPLAAPGAQAANEPSAPAPQQSITAPPQADQAPPPAPEAALSPAPENIQPMDEQPSFYQPEAAPSTDTAAFVPEQAASSAASLPDEAPISWSASEYVAHHKNAGWYLTLILAALVLATGVYFLTKDRVSSVSIVVITLLLAAYGSRPPRVLNYQLDGSGLTIGAKHYSYGQFRSFALMEEGAFQNIALVPLQRFMPLITIYFAPQDEERILDLLATRLPLENRSQDMIDRFMRKIRF